MPVRTARRGAIVGALVVIVIACVATVFGRFLPVLGGPVCGIVLGLLAGVVVPRLRSSRLSAGYDFCAKQVLQASVVLLGTGLSLRQVAKVGASSLPVMLASLVVALGGATLIGRRLGVGRDVRTLIGVGTGICGASAIAASTAVMRPKKADAAYALGTIFVFNVIGVLTFPAIGHLLGMTGESFGLWAGTAINDTSSVVAAAYGFGDGAGDHAIVVKLTRSLMIIPITMVLAYLTARRSAAAASSAGSVAGGRSPVRIPLSQVVPWFLVGFVVAAAVNSGGLVPSSWHPALSSIATFGITLALTAIGLSMRPSELRRTGVRPLLLGAILSVLVASTSLGVQALTGSL
ncbi:YeiH family protein [Calidifontibacter indicus]|nr:putative sulfate exporter family transporter [Calidifontibacter indicus]